MTIVRFILPALALLACQSPGTIVIEASEPCDGERGEPVDVDVYFVLEGECPEVATDLCQPFSCLDGLCEHACTADCSYADLAQGIDQLHPDPGTYAVILDFAYADGSYGLTCAAGVQFDADGTRDAVIQPQQAACCP